MKDRTALVTGASSGLGETFAHELASRGFRLVLVARGADRLAAVAREASERHGADVTAIEADLTRPDDLGRVEQRLAGGGPPIDLLVNNAGVLGRIAPLTAQPVEDQETLIGLSVLAVVRLCRAALPGMVRRGGGGVLNVASIMAFLPAPQGATYAAAKAFVTSFSESVHCEVRDHGVHVTALCPGSVRTRLHRSSGGGGGRLGSYLEPERVVRDGLAAVAAGRPLCIPSLEYRCKIALARLAPRGLVRRAVLRRWGAAPDRAAGAAPDPAQQ